MPLEKTWVVTSGNPRPSHSAVNGETVPVGETFSNGLTAPGDPSNGPEDAANCSCILEITGEVKQQAGAPFESDRYTSPTGTVPEHEARLAALIDSAPRDLLNQGTDGAGLKGAIRYLRGTIRDPGAVTDADLERYANQIKATDELTAKYGYEFKRDEVLYRGVEDDTGWFKPEVGKTWEDKGYTFASMKSEIGKQYIDENGWFIKVVMPEGSKALPYDRAYAMILPRGGRYEILSVDREARTVEMRMITGEQLAPPPADLSGLTDWAEGAFQDVNNYLRFGSEPLELDDEEEALDIVRRMDSAMRPLEEDQTSFRFIGDGFGSKLHEGDVFTDRGFVSTSTDHTWALNNAPSDAWRVTVTSPAGTQAADIAGLGIRTDESELLLGRGQTFRVTYVNENVHTIGLEVVDDRALGLPVVPAGAVAPEEVAVELTPAETASVKNIEKSMRDLIKTYSEVTDRPFVKLEWVEDGSKKTMPLENAKRVLLAMKRIAAKSPESLRACRGIQIQRFVNQDCYAQVLYSKPGIVQMEAKWFGGNLDHFNADLDYGGKTGWLSTNSIEGTLTHELGHIEFAALGNEETAEMLAEAGWLDRVELTEAAKMVSQYAQTGKGEMLAELWSGALWGAGKYANSTAVAAFRAVMQEYGFMKARSKAPAAVLEWLRDVELGVCGGIPPASLLRRGD